MSSVEAQRVIASLKKDNKEYNPSEIDCMVATNSWPTMQVDLVVNSDQNSSDIKATRVNLKLIEQLKQFKNEKDVYTLTFGIEDDQITSVQSIIHAINMTVSVQDISLKLDLMPEYTKVDRLNLSIFKHDSQWGTGQDIDGISKLPKTKDYPYLTDYIKATFSFIKERWDNNKDSFLKSDSIAQLTKKTVEKIDENNQELYSIFETLLDNSRESVGQLYQINKLYKDYDTTLFVSICNTLTQANNSFLSTITSLCNLFGLLYVPGLEDIGYLTPKASIIDDPKSSAFVPIVNCFLHSGSKGIGRLGYVYTESNIVKDIDGSNRKGQQPDRNVLVSYPENPNFDKSSSNINILPPPWIPQSSFSIPAEVIKEGDPSNDSDGKKPKETSSLTQYKNNVSAALQEWCRQEYYYQKYAPSNAILHTFFHKVDQMFGNVINVADNYEVIFRGYVHGYRQRVIKNISQGDISTSASLIGALFTDEKAE